MNRVHQRALARCASLRGFRGALVKLNQVVFICFLIGFLNGPSPARAASAISLAGIDFQQLCRETAHVPLVQAAIHPAYINVWTVQESRERGRYEQYSFRTQRIDVRVEHDISLYHGLVHRTLDLIGESQWRHRDFEPYEDHEHWLIYYTLEMHWPGVQRRQGNEPTRNLLTMAVDYWRQRPERYNEIVAKAAELAELSWCALNAGMMEASLTPAPRTMPGAQAARQAAVPIQSREPEKPSPVPQPAQAAPAALAETPLSVEKAQPAPPATPWPAEPQQTLAALTPPAPASVARLPEMQAEKSLAAAAPAPAPAAERALTVQSLLIEPIWVMSEFAVPPPQPRTLPPAWALSHNHAAQSESWR